MSCNFGREGWWLVGWLFVTLFVHSHSREREGGEEIFPTKARSMIDMYDMVTGNNESHFGEGIIEIQFLERCFDDGFYVYTSTLR